MTQKRVLLYGRSSRISSSLLELILLIALLPFSPMAAAQDLQSEEAEDYYRKWLNEDVVYIITGEEKSVFESLSTPEEKEQFIEQFWFRRDSDPTTVINEFKEEHYRRIAYANERFGSGFPGWRTDRGRIYIIHGPPDEIESYPSGGSYTRPLNEGGGTTNTFPFEIWRYRHIEGIGSDVLLEFVDATMSDEYRLAQNAEEKDALLHIPGGGPTLAEELGLATKADRPFFTGLRREDYPMMATGPRDNPFIRYENYSMVQKPRPIKYRDLKQIVDVNIDFASIPFTSRTDYFRLNDKQALVSLSIQVENKNLSFKPEGLNQMAKLAVYGLITSITNRLVEEFDHDLVAVFPSNQLQAGLTSKSIYQKVLVVERRLRYKLNVVIKDLDSDRVGVLQTAIIPPPFDEESLSGSSLILSDSVQILDSIPDAEEMFVIGDVKVRPSLDKSFSRGDSLGVYYQLYNASIDQSTLQPSLRICYRILKDGLIVSESVDETGESLQFVSGRRVVLLKRLSLEQLEPGRYGLQIQVEDQLNGQRLDVKDDFRVIENRLAMNPSLTTSAP